MAKNKVSSKLQKEIEQHDKVVSQAKSEEKQASSIDRYDPVQVFNLPSWFKAGVFLRGTVNKQGNRTLRGISESSTKNITLILENDSNSPKPFYDEFSETFMYLDEQGKATLWDASESNDLKLYIEETYDYTPTPTTVENGVKVYAKTHPRNLVKERVEAVKWDSIQRVATLFIDFLGALNEDYTKEITKRWFTGMIKRVYEPGCKFELVPILYGDQGMGKSDLAHAIFPDNFVDNLDTMKLKDDLLKLNGKMVCELGEMLAFNASSTDQIKSFISERNDLYRAPYSSVIKDHPRKTVFLGTTNKETFLKDETGERRFYPIRCFGEQATKNPHNIDDAYMLQVLAEAKTLYEAGYKCYIDIKEDAGLVKVASSKQEQAKEYSMVDDEIEQYLESTVPPDYENRYFSLDLNDKREIYQKSKKKQPKNWVKIPFVNTKDIWAVGLGNEKEMRISGRVSDSQKINLRMATEKKWASTQHFKGKYIRGYLRKEP